MNYSWGISRKLTSLASCLANCKVPQEHHVLQAISVEYSKQGKRIHTSRLEQSLTDSEVPCKNPAYLYWSVNEQLALQRLSRRFSQVYQSVWIHACRCVYANAARGFTLRRVSHIVPISGRKRRFIRPCVHAGYAWFGIITFLPLLWEKELVP